jgi:hypothetical protein
MDYDLIKQSAILIGYYIPNEPPRFHGSGFIIGKGDKALTCAHVVMPPESFTKGIPNTYKKHMQINGKQAEFSCWAYRTMGREHHIIRLPIKAIALMTNYHIESYYVGGMPDIAYLELDTSQYHSKFEEESLPALTVSKKIMRNVGDVAAIVGYPSPNSLMLDPKTNQPRCMEALVQFTQLAGVLPFSKIPMPALLAFDTIIAKGSSGSPIIDLDTRQVVAIAAQLLPFDMPTFTDHGVYQTPVPAAIGFGIPSNFFYEISISGSGEGKFSFNEIDFQ